MSREGSGKSGWCMTGHHDNCPHEIYHSMTKTANTCLCKCHGASVDDSVGGKT